MLPIDQYFDQQDEPLKSCLLFLRQHILSASPQMTEAWKYRMPFYYYANNRCCYLWIHKLLQQPYIGVADGKNIAHPGLLLENRSRMKIFLVDPAQEISVATIDTLLYRIIALYDQSNNSPIPL